MKKSSFTLVALGVATLLSAGPYNDNQSYGGCPNGNCPYQNQPSCGPQCAPAYNQNYYQGDCAPQPPQHYAPRQPGRSPQGYGNPPAYQGQYPGQPSSYGQQPRPTQSQVPDTEIAKHIRDVLGSGWFSKGYQDVTFDLTNGNVILRGSVENLDDKKKIEESIKKIAGIRHVTNQIVVRSEKTSAANGKSSSPYTSDATKAKSGGTAYSQDYAATDSDKEINAKIRDKLSSGWLIKGYEMIIIRTTNGMVTVTGLVERPEDIQKINDTIKKIDGVKNVTNQATVRSK